jgi:hypothetical protein
MKMPFPYVKRSEAITDQIRFQWVCDAFRKSCHDGWCCVQIPPTFAPEVPTAELPTPIPKFPNKDCQADEGTPTTFWWRAPSTRDEFLQ